MLRYGRRTVTLVALVIAVAAASSLDAQSVLASLGLTEAAARTFLLDELTRPADDRRDSIHLTGTRAFLTLPRSARGPAAAALVSWAKLYVGSTAFKTAYGDFRRETIPPELTYALTVEESVKKQMDEARAMLEDMRKSAASMPPEAASKFLASLEEQEARLKGGELAKMLTAAIQAERAEKTGSTAGAGSASTRYPADPAPLFEQRLREFLDATADVDFAARTMSLTGGIDGIEFLDPPDRERSIVWQQAVIVGPEATAAARAAAQAWLKEFAR